MYTASAANRSRRYPLLNLLLPSSLSTVFYVFLAAVIIISNQFEQVQHYLNLPSQIHFEHAITKWLDHFLISTLGQGRTETAVVGTFWAIVGIFVYIFLRGLARMISEVGEDVQERGYIWPKGTNRYQPLKRFMEISLFRVGAFVSLVFYFLHPLSAVLRGPVLIRFAGDSKIVRYIIWYVVTILVLHGFVVLLRLLALRERL